jgi:alkylated DNA nucleotide flippase Atl1
VDYVEQVLTAVESIPPGRACAYSDLAELVGRGGPRQVGQVMARYGAGVPWWRVVRADGRPARGLEEQALARLRAEGTPLRGDRVDLVRARFAFCGADLDGDSP